jgi:phage terminase large subunit-like protein
LTGDTSEGFDWVTFARDSMRRNPYPWQRWLSIHGGELLPDGRPRFRYVWVLVARQNGKTEVPVMLSGYWMFVASVPLILGTSTKLDYAKESWSKLVKLIRKSPDPDVQRMLPQRKWTRETNGEQECWCYATDEQDPDELSRYKIAAANEDGGRSLTVHKGICDEIRQHHDYSAWGAIDSTMTAVWDAQLWCLSNAGSAKSVVLNEARDAALEFIRTGEGDYRTALFEWSSPPGSRPDDPYALAMANPQFNRPGVDGKLTIDGDVLIAEGRKALKAGGDLLISFQTEKMCISVTNLKPAYDESKWKLCNVPGDLSMSRWTISMRRWLPPPPGRTAGPGWRRSRRGAMKPIR